MTTKDAIKLLPIEEDLKLQVLTMYDYMDPEQKLMIERIAWNSYDLMKKATIEENVELQFEKVKEGQAALDENFYGEVLKSTDQELHKEAQESAGSMDLAVARRAMQQIVKEMQDVKDAKKSHSKKSTK